MIVDELFPGLALHVFWKFDHVSSDGTGGMLNAKLDHQFLEYFVFSPVWIFSRYTLYKFDVSSRYARPTDFICSRAPSPIEFESQSVPSDYRIGFHNDETRFPSAPNPG